MTMPIPSGTWTIDKSHSTVEFVIRHLGLSKVRGRFNDFTATLTVGDTYADTRLDASVDLASVDTNNADRDAHLRSTDFFAVDAAPTMQFASTSIVERAGRHAVTGNLTLNGRTGVVVLDTELNGTETYPMDGSTHAGFSATTEISRRDWGIDFNVPLAAGGVVLGDKVRIELEVQLQHEPVAATAP